MKLAVTLLVSGFMLAGLSGCGDSGSDKSSATAEKSMNEGAAQVMEEAKAPETKTEDLKEAASEWKDKTGELIEKTVDVAKEKAVETKEGSVELYEAAKTKAVDVAETVSEKSSDIYQAGKEKGAEMLDNMSENLKEEPAAE